jgi:hypothetical protein
MKDVTPINYETLKEFEDKIGGNVKIGGYDMDKICPVDEGVCYKITLEESDLVRIFLLGETTFTKLTKDENYKLSDLQDVAREQPRVKYWLDKQIDLAASVDWAPVFVSLDIENGALISIDGNHG